MIEVFGFDTMVYDIKTLLLIAKILPELFFMRIIIL